MHLYLKNGFSLLRKMNFVLLGLVFATIATGLFFIYGTGQQNAESFGRFWIKQSVWIVIGCGIMLVLSLIDYRHYGRHAGVIYMSTVLLLIAVLMFGKRINGARSWLPVGPGIAVQPSEFSKLGLVIIISWIASRPSTRFRSLRDLVPYVVLAAIPFALILMQPDMGSAIVLVPITLAITFISGMKKRWLLYGLILALVSAPLVYKYVFKDHQRKRLHTFLNPSKNPTKEGWNARQSLLAVGSGGLTGKGYMKGTQNVLGFLPKSVAPTDFIFSVIAEESGFAGSSLLISAFCGIMLSCIYIAATARDSFGRNLACGIAVLLCVHIYINIGMTVGLAPIIGIPLPFVSYGGSFMILMLSSIGVIQSVYIRRRTC